MITTIPLNKLVQSPRNVRRSGNGTADCELKADIEARGILQNLVVTSVKKPRGCFAVEAGERRRRALQSLADEGKLDSDHEVCCLVIDGSAAEETSLAENFQRLAMNPADECLAFRTLIEQGADCETIARRFGLTVRFVEGRLRLAGLAPAVFGALGAGEISLDVAKAYSATPDCERQAWVFEQLRGGYSSNHPDSIRRMMTQATIAADDRRASFVGEEAYLAAGGRIERDLFCDEAQARWIDVVLVERLATEKLQAAADRLANEQELAFVRPTLDSWVGYPATEGLRHVELERAPLSDEEKSRIDALESEIDQLSEIFEDEEADEPSCLAAESRISDLNDEIRSIADKPPLIPEELKSEVGTFLLLDERGRPRLHSVYFLASTEDARLDAQNEVATTGPSAAAPRVAGLSRRLVDELSIQRRDILAAHVASDGAFALDLAIFLIADRTRGGCGRHGSSLSALAASDPLGDFEAAGSPAGKALDEAGERLDRSWTGFEEAAERFDRFRSLPARTKEGWLAHCLARTLAASANVAGERSCRFHDHLGRSLGIETARWWRPTGANFFDRVPKAMMLDALREVGGDELAQTYAKSKKAELAQACERIFAGDFIAADEVKQAALDWVPEAMRFAETEEAGCGEDTAELETPPWEAEPGVTGEEVVELEAAA